MSLTTAAALPTFERITTAFEVFDDWEDRYRYLIDIGKKLAAFPEADKTEVNRVQGCTSRVWLIYALDDEQRFLFQGDSDSAIVKGLVTVLLSLYANHTAEEILAVDVKAALEQLDLANHLSTSRRNGLFSMSERIRSQAQAGL